MSPSSIYSSSTMYVYDYGSVRYSNANNSFSLLLQSIYLDSSVKYIGGDGTAEKAFEIE